MIERNTSPYAMFRQIAERHVPRNRFAGDFDTWQHETLPLVLETLGGVPDQVDPSPELIVEFEHGGLTCQRWLINVSADLAVELAVNRPTDITSPRPAILCWHGHNRYGKEPIMGNDSSPALREMIANTGTDYGRHLAEAGFVTFAIDWMGRGALDDTRKPHFISAGEDRDWCNLYYLNATMLGMTPLGLNLAFGRVATGVAAELPFVDQDHIGVIGESGGGTLALWAALTDERISAVEISCYSDLFAAFGFRDLNYCGSQITPGLFKLVDVPDLQGLLAPQPLLVDIGAYDECFLVTSAMACFRRTQEIYAASGFGDQLELNLYPGGHGCPKNASADFFSRHLSPIM